HVGCKRCPLRIRCAEVGERGIALRAIDETVVLSPGARVCLRIARNRCAAGSSRDNRSHLRPGTSKRLLHGIIGPGGKTARVPERKGRTRTVTGPDDRGIGWPYDGGIQRVCKVRRVLIP